MSKIEESIIKSIQKAVKGVYKDCPKEALSNVYLEAPKEKRFGDFSTNVAMRLTKDLKRSPMDIAAEIAKGLKGYDIKIERPGFINFYLSAEAVLGSLGEILAQKDRFGRLSIGKGESAQIEFVSANPTGPLTVAHGRQAALGDSLARILVCCGYKVVREYYINDEGVQISLLGRSVKARLRELCGEKSDFPEDGYKGEYIYEIAREIRELPRIKSRIATNEKISDDFFEGFAYKWIMKGIKKDLEDFGVKFDVWYSQKKLTESGKIEKALAVLRKKGFLYDKDGALWFASSRLGDDKDRVIIKSDKSFTYLAPDIAYHKEKFEKGYERIVNIWGPDHHGYINRLKAACQALGYDKDKLSILISQLVSLHRDKKPVAMSTRQGEFVTLRQVIAEVGRDAGRFFFIMRRTDSHLDFDLELAKQKTMDNPVYYIQYAHARISSVINFSGENKPDAKNLSLLNKPEEINIIKTLMQFPGILETSARNLEPYTLLAYLQGLASLFHSYYNSHRIVTDDKSLTSARLLLAKAIKTVLFNGLSLLGVSTPEKM
ncbi:MAG: arginine--tRNA ligase [Candidatus Omnitrophica bacterium]|nr:arginine--tRNA ligase [Candidatus Omnitrophota bacterium]